MRALFAAFLATGCATAEPAGHSGVDSGVPGDGNEVTLDSSMSDAMIDAPPGPQTRTLSQTTSNTIKAVNTVACPGTNGNPGTSTNSYYRVFDLAAFGITTDFNVTKVTFQVEHCDNLTGSGTCANLAVRVGTYAGTPGATLSDPITILASNATVAVPEVIENTTGNPPTTPGGTVDAPIIATIPAGSKLLVQVDAPDGTNNYAFYMGSNDGGETGFGYVMASTCNITVPSNISSMLGMTPAAPRHLLLTVTGTY